MECSKCGKLIVDSASVVSVTRGLWLDDPAGFFATYYVGKISMTNIYHITCYRQMVGRSSVKGHRVGFYADGDKMIPFAGH